MRLWIGIVFVALVAAGPGCVGTKAIPYVADANVKGIPRDQAKTSLKESFGRSRSWMGKDLDEVTVGDARFRYLVQPPNNLAPRYDVDFAYAEVKPVLFEVTSTGVVTAPWGRFGLTFKKGEEVVQDAAIYFQALEEAQRAADAVTSLSAAPAAEKK